MFIAKAQAIFEKIDEQRIKDLNALKTTRNGISLVKLDCREAERNSITTAAAIAARYYVNTANRVRAELAEKKGIPNLPREVDTYA